MYIKTGVKNTRPKARDPGEVGPRAARERPESGGTGEPGAESPESLGETGGAGGIYI